MVLSMGDIVSILSGKGGVGKTTVTLNIAYALKEFGYDTLVVEGNVTSPTASLYLGFLPAEKTINNVLKDEIDLEEAVLEHSSGIKLLTCSLSLADLVSNYERAFELVKKLKNKADFVFIDAAAGLGNEARSAMIVSDYIIVVTNPELASAVDALRVVRLARAFEIPVLGVIVNKVNYAMPQLPVEEIEGIVEAPVIGVVHEDRAVNEAYAYNQPVTYLRPKAKASVQFKSIAARLIGYQYAETPNPLLDKLSFWLHKLGLRYLP